MEIFLPVKVLSVNDCWKGQRYKTNDYKYYEQLVFYQLPATKLPPGPYEINYIFGMSNSNSDLDNPVKPLQDILQKKYQFNDNQIIYCTILKKQVPKKQEFFSITIKTYKGKI